MNKQTILKTSNLTKIYGRQKSVDDLNLHICKGKIYGLLGRNGAGKTTTMKMILGLTKPTSGSVDIWGMDVRNNKKEILPHIGSLIESPGFYSNLTGRENLEIFASLRRIRNKTVVKNALDFVDLPYDDKKLFSQYSMGMKQRLAIALAIMHSPDLLVLDEPTNGLDPIGITEMRNFIKNLCDKEGKTILLSTHILSEIELLADDIGIIDEGKLIVEGSKKELEQSRRNYIEIFVSDSDVIRSEELIRSEFHVTELKNVRNGIIRIYEKNISIPALVKMLVNNNIDVERVYVDEESLEDYFINVTGGIGIA